jgi:cytochrome c-type protein NapB
MVASRSRTARAGVIVCTTVAIAFAAGACARGGVADRGANKSAATVRAERRAYDGAPPVAPHAEFGMSCVQCHNLRGMDVPEVGFAPPSPHELTDGMSALSRCRQCHVFQQTTTEFAASTFAPLRQDLRSGQRLSDLSPPVMPHKLLMRENCSACHTGPAAREEIRTPHPDRVRCMQCHVPQRTADVFASELAALPH